MKRVAPFLAAALSLSACASAPHAPNPVGAPQPAALAAITRVGAALSSLPPPTEPVTVAVYGFNDLSGQFKPSDQGQTLSRAVSQGGGAMLVRALSASGGHSWFTVLEREELRDVLTERQLIGEMRQRYLGEKGVNPDVLPPMKYAGVIIEGAVIGYDSNVRTGGLGARFLGVGAHREYRQDTITVSLRAVSVKTGEVLATVQTAKTLASVAVSADTFRYVDYKDLLEAEGGTTRNEPAQLALQQAIEKAVFSLIMEGCARRLWAFKDPAAGEVLLGLYRQENDGAAAMR